MSEGTNAIADTPAAAAEPEPVAPALAEITPALSEPDPEPDPQITNAPEAGAAANDAPEQDPIAITEENKDGAVIANGIDGLMVEEGGFAEPMEHDILNGRGASVNAHSGNKKFRALCFSRKPEFEAGNHAAKRRVATEIVNVTKAWPGRFLKKKAEKGLWYELNTEKAILKACQVMRDFQRPDRVLIREIAAANGSARKRQRTGEPSTPGVDAVRIVIVVDPYNGESRVLPPCLCLTYYISMYPSLVLDSFLPSILYVYSHNMSRYRLL